MRSSMLTISIEKGLLRRIDRWVADGRYSNRNKAIEAAVRDKLEHLRKRRLAQEAAKLDPTEERALAEEGL